MEALKGFIYNTLDILTLKKGIKKNISGFEVRLPIRFHSYFPSDYEYENFQFLEKSCKKGGIVIDIGAHIGLFAIRASQVVGEKGKVYAFEPTPQTHNLLLKTIAINKKQSCVVPRKEAVAEKEGVTFFNISEHEGDNSNSLVEYRHDKKLEKVEVKLVSIDSFLADQNLQNVDFVKIDAEGYEYFVLLGAKKTFTSKRPTGILALHPAGIKANGNTLQDIYRFLEEVNYRALYKDRFLTEQEFCSYNNLFDVYLLPNEKSR
jgi:FkbM family methyltransferase